MILTDYLRSEPDLTWDIALQCGVRHGVIRLPEDPDFDVTSLKQLQAVTDRFKERGITPLIVEPLPNCLHDHIKLGDELREASIDQFIQLMANMHEVGLKMVCFNFMAHYGWTRTEKDIIERGGAKVTGFCQDHFVPDDFELDEQTLWQNYEYFIKRVIPYAEKYDIKLALHPDDPPLPTLGKVARIFTSYEAIKKGLAMADSDHLGVTFCQACYRLMGEDLHKVVPELAKKIFFIHFRNVCGDKTCFRETFHDNGEIAMAAALKLYKENGISVPIRVDHVPTMVGEDITHAGYDAMGRLFAIGYLKGILEGISCI